MLLRGFLNNFSILGNHDHVSLAVLKIKNNKMNESSVQQNNRLSMVLLYIFSFR